MGTYTCNVGDTVEFFLGNYPLGRADATDGILDVETDLPNGVVVMRLLEGIDSAEDGFITIPDGFNALDNVTAAPGDTDFEKEVNAAGITLEDETVVAENHAEGLLEVYLAGKTFHIEEETFGTTISFNTNLTEINVGAVAVPIGTYTAPISSGIVELHSGGLQVPDLGFITLTEKTEHYLLFTYNTDQTVKFYFDEPIAILVSKGYTPLTEEILSGEILYHVEAEYDNGDSSPKTGDLYSSMTLANGTLTRKEVWVNAANPEDTASDSFTVSYEIIDGEIRIDVPAMDGDPAMYIWWTLTSESVDSWTINDLEDLGKDGEIDDGNQDTYYLTKPDGFPASL